MTHIVGLMLLLLTVEATRGSLETVSGFTMSKDSKGRAWATGSIAMLRANREIPRKYFEDGFGESDDPPATMATSIGRPLLDDSSSLDQTIVQDRDRSTFSDSAAYWEDHIVQGAKPGHHRKPKPKIRKNRPTPPKPQIEAKSKEAKAPPATPPREYPPAPAPSTRREEIEAIEKKKKEALDLTDSLEKMTKTVESYEANEEAKNAAMEAGVPVDDEDARNEAPPPETLGQEAVRKLGEAMGDGPSLNDMVKTMEEDNARQNTPDT